MWRYLIGVLAAGGAALLIGAPATPSPTALTTQAVATCAPALVSTSPLPTLTQHGGDWDATVLVTGLDSCPAQLVFRLDTTPASAVPADTVAVPQSSAEVPVTFRLAGVPQAATLVVTGPTGESSVSLVISRQVGPWFYLVLPGLCGLVLAVLLLLSMATVRVYGSKPGQGPKPLRSFSQEFWRWSVSASGAWAASDSWATNLGTLIGVFGAVTSLNASAAVFWPGVSLDRFALLFAVAGGIIALAPLVFAIQYARWTNHLPGLTSEATLWLPMQGPPLGTPLTLASEVHAILPAGTPITLPDATAGQLTTLTQASLPATTRVARLIESAAGDVVLLAAGSTAVLHGGLAVECQATVLTLPPNTALRPSTDQRADKPLTMHLPAGASLTPAAPAMAWGPAGLATLPANQPLRLPPDSTVTLLARRIALPQGTDLIAQGGTVLTINGPDSAGALVLSADELLPFPLLVWVPTGGTITATDLATVTLPAGTEVSTPNRAPATSTDSWPPLSLSTTSTGQLVGTLRMVTVAALCTMFGIGVEVGLAVSLCWLSDASTVARWVLTVLAALVGVFLLRYAMTAIRTMADPKPGSSLSSVSGTSFTL